MTRLLLGVTVGVYAGWSTAAVWINAVTVLPQGPPLAGPALTALQCLAVAGAGVAAALGVRALRGQLPCVATVAYALVGVSVSAARADASLLLATAVVALAAVAVVAVVSRTHEGPGRGAPATV